jgi:hypothetical protein
MHYFNKNCYVFPLYIKGDVNNPQALDNPESAGNILRIDNNGRKIKAFSLAEIISAAEPATDKYSIYLISDDGRASRLSGEALEKSYLFYSRQQGWEALNLNHPVSTNLKKIREIIVVNESSNTDYGLNIINMQNNLEHITPGQALLYSQDFLEHAGTSFKDIDGKNYATDSYKQKNIIGIDKFFEIKNSESLIIIGSNGSQSYMKNPGSVSYFEITDNAINFVNEATGEKIEDIKGIVINPSAGSITDVYYDASGYINNGKKVMFILADGLGYHQYEYAKANGYAPFLSSINPAQIALSVYQPVSNAGLAAMLTGQPPDINGISSRKQREPLVATIFQELIDSKKHAVFIEGDIQIIKTETAAMLNTDLNLNGTIDDEIFKQALEYADLKPDFLVIHFHGIDDAGHNWGDLDSRTMEQIKIIDSYIKELSSSWSGKIIITSDHGMHKTDEGGSHGQFRYEDMVVPYILTDGGL